MTLPIPWTRSQGLGGWVSDTRSGTETAADAVTTFSEVAGGVEAAGAGEVDVKDPKQISTGSARKAAMLAGKTTPDWATMLHSEFPIAPTWRANCQGVRPGPIH